MPRYTKPIFTTSGPAYTFRPSTIAWWRLPRHEVVDLAGRRDQLRLRLDGRGDEEPRVFRDAVAADAGAGDQHHAIGARVHQFAHAVRVHPKLLADQRDLVREGDLDVPIRILRGLHHLGGCPVRRVDLRFHEPRVEGE